MRPYYEQDGIVIYHGDCRDVLPHIHGDIVVTDPPYGIGVAGWDVLVPVDSWLPLARRIGPVVLFCGVKGCFDYPRPDWIGAWMRLASTQRMGALRGFNNWEPILMYGLKSLSNDVISLPNIPDVDAREHPSPKPRRLIATLLTRLPVGSVIDPFAGSGTTLVEAKRLGRRAIGIELEEEYCEMAAARLAQGALFGEATA
jgi:DNA modification methylase